MIDILFGVIASITASAALHFQANEPSRRNSEACQSLANLLVALRAIGETGQQIGIALDSIDTNLGDDQARKNALDSLIQMLEVQNHNIREANQVLPEIENILKIQTPQLSELYFHLRGKNHRIDILYDAAKIKEIEEHPKKNVEHWEVSKLQGEEQTMRDILDEALAANIISNVTIGENIREKDKNFQALMDAIEPLEKIINEKCSLGDLK